MNLLKIMKDKSTAEKNYFPKKKVARANYQTCYYCRKRNNL